MESKAKMEAQLAEETANEALEELRGSVAMDIPGVTFEDTLDTYVEGEFADDLDACKTTEERKALKQKLRDHYLKNPAGKKFFQDNFNNLKTYFGQAMESLEELPNAINAMISSASIPSVITTGQATSVQNPTWVIKDLKAKTSAVIGIVQATCGYFGMLLGTMALLRISPPKSVLQIQSKLNQIQTLISAIPL